MAERNILHQILKEPNLISEFNKKGIIIHDSSYRKILAYLIDYYESNGVIVIADIISSLDKDLEDYPPMTVDDLAKILIDEYPKTVSKQVTLEKINELADPKAQAELAKKLINQAKKNK